jgi:hypothetical protein
MDKKQVISDILEAYRKGKPNPTIEGKCSELLFGLSEQMFKTVTDWILDNPPDFRADVRYIKDAIRECTPSGVGFPVYEVDCPLCSTHFRHSPYAGSDEAEKGVYYECPLCGLSGVEIRDAEHFMNKHGYFPGGWERTLRWQAERWKKRTNKFCPDGFAPYHDKRFDGTIVKPYSKPEEIERYIKFLSELQKEIGRERVAPEPALK